MNNEQTELQKYTEKLLDNIYDIIASICILRTIEEVAEKINQDGHGSYYSYIQKQMINTSILSLNRIFDSNQKSISINRINNHIKSNYRKIPITDPYIANNFRYFKNNDLLSINNSCQLATFLMEKFTNIEKSFQDDINALKDLRDKYIAHSDTRKIKSRTTWEKVDELVDFLLDYLDLIDSMLLSRGLSVDKERSCIVLISGAKQPGRSLARTFQKLGYIKDLDEIEAIKV